MTGCPDFVVVGTGRSGTGYISRVLTEAGMPCGHESWWNPMGEHQDGLRGDASWCALALALDDYDGLVWHQHRHPLDVVTSMAHQPLHEPYRALQLRLMPDDPIDPWDWAALATVTYLEAAEARASRSWSVNDVDGRLVKELAARVGVDVTNHRATVAVDAVPPDTNRHHDQPRADLEVIPSLELRRRVHDTIDQLGYRCVLD